MSSSNSRSGRKRVVGTLANNDDSVEMSVGLLSEIDDSDESDEGSVGARGEEAGDSGSVHISSSSESECRVIETEALVDLRGVVMAGCGGDTI